MSYYCDNPREHKREGERDFERGGRYGYDDRQYHDSFDPCSRHYREGFDDARREQERREERRQEEQDAQAREDRRIHNQRMAAREEDEQREQQHEWEQQEDYAAMERAHYHGQALKFCHDHQMSRRERIKWMRRNGYTLKIPS